jgi:hypothetical protein
VRDPKHQEQARAAWSFDGWRVCLSVAAFAVEIYSSSTVIASVGHEVTQAMQRMQSSGLTGTDFCVSGCSGRSCSSKTSTGQTSTQTPSPLHLVRSTSTFGMFI